MRFAHFEGITLSFIARFWAFFGVSDDRLFSKNCGRAKRVFDCDEYRRQEPKWVTFLATGKGVLWYARTVVAGNDSAFDHQAAGLVRYSLQTEACMSFIQAVYYDRVWPG